MTPSEQSSALDFMLHLADELYFINRMRAQIKMAELIKQKQELTQ